MNEGHEISEADHRIMPHESRRAPAIVSAIGDDELTEAVDRHIEQHLGPVGSVFHDIVSDLVHVALHVVPPAKQRPYHTIVTSGMSERPMTVPDGAEDFRFAELMLSLPADWPLNESALQNEDHYWPLRWLKALARLPHEYETWLAWGHSVPNGDPPRPFAPATSMCGVVLLEPQVAPAGFTQLQINHWKSITFLAVFPLHPDELTYKRERGTEALEERLLADRVTEILDARRPSVIRRRGWRSGR